MTDAGEDRLEHATAPIRASADRGRLTPVLWGAGLLLVVAVAVAGQRPPAVAPTAVTGTSLPAVATDGRVAAADPTRDLSSLPWDTSRRWAGDLVVRRYAPPWLDRPFGETFARVRDRLTAPLAR